MKKCAAKERLLSLPPQLSLFSHVSRALLSLARSLCVSLTRRRRQEKGEQITKGESGGENGKNGGRTVPIRAATLRWQEERARDRQAAFFFSLRSLHLPSLFLMLLFQSSLCACVCAFGAYTHTQRLFAHTCKMQNTH